ncbi:MAG: cell division protein ZapA [Bacteroidetes bacterium]|nr:cell division protein ZapA [Bacteroidota bacterium]MCK4406771.1 cell division protein ZapA [Bacteroidales bacterium]MCK4638134.1 cell division protein ZapA [Bacteroidales bacterium]
MDELTISVTIADRPYRLTIKKEEEETIRKAAKFINEKIKDYSENYAFNDKQDLLAMVSLQYANTSLNLEKQYKDKDNRFAERLIEINKVLSDNLV